MELGSKQWVCSTMIIKPAAIRPARPLNDERNGYCRACYDKKGTHEAVFQLVDCKIVVRYCDRCVQGAEYKVDD